MSYADEMTLIATIAINGMTPDAADAIAILDESMLTDNSARDAFRAICKLHNNNLVINAASIADMCEMPGAFDWLLAVCESTAPTGQVSAFAGQVRRAAKSAMVSAGLRRIAHHLETSPMIDAAELSQEIAGLAGEIDFHTGSLDPRSFKELAQGYVELLTKRYDDNEHSGLDIGINALVNRTDLIIVGGTPGMGKTALLLFIVRYLFEQGQRSLIFSLEMEDQQLFEREVSRLAKVPIKALKRPALLGVDNEGKRFADHDMLMSQVAGAVGALTDVPCHVDDRPGLSLESMRNKIRRHLQRFPDTKLIAVDYLGLMTLPAAQNQNLAIATVTRNLKLMAKEFKTPIMLLSQMNRDAAKAKREPEISDLRDSGAIEQDADVIIFPYREEVYFPESKNKGLAKILKRKVRDDEPGDVFITFERGSFYAADGREWRGINNEVITV